MKQIKSGKSGDSSWEQEVSRNKSAALQELRNLIMEAFYVRQMAINSATVETLTGQGVHFVRLDNGQTVLLKYDLQQTASDCRLTMTVKIDGYPSTMKEVVRLYKQLQLEN